MTENLFDPLLVKTDHSLLFFLLILSMLVFALLMLHASDSYRPSIKSIPRCRCSSSGKTCLAQPFSTLSNPSPSVPPESLVAEIGIVNDLCDAFYPAVSDRELFA